MVLLSDQLETYLPGIHLRLDQLIRLQQESNHLGVKPTRRITSALAGAYQSRFRGRGMDFDEVRQYQAGDDIRSIDWRVTARTQKVHTKLYREERERPVFVCLDQQRSMFFGSQNTLKSVLAAATASTLIWSAIKKQDRVGAILFTEDGHFDKKPAASRRASLAIFKRLVDTHNQQIARLQSATNVNSNALNDNLRRLRNVVTPGSLVYLLTDFTGFDETSERHLTQLAKHNDVVAYWISDPLELGLPPKGDYPITDGQTTASLAIPSEHFRKEYERAIYQRVEAIKSHLRKNRIQLVSLMTSSQWAEKVIAFLQDNEPGHVIPREFA